MVLQYLGTKSKKNINKTKKLDSKRELFKSFYIYILS